MANDKHPAGGERAYPFQSNSVEYGLTKRELFAAMAMQGILAESGGAFLPDFTAGLAVKNADALIAELCK